MQSIPQSAAPIFVERAAAYPPIFVDSGLHHDLAPIYVEPAPIYVDQAISHSPAKRIYPVAHPYMGGFETSASYPKVVTNVYYVDEYGNRVPDPESAATEYYESPRKSSVTHSQGHHSRASSRSGSPSRARSRSGGDLWDRLAQPRTTPRRQQEPQSARKRSTLSEDEREEIRDRLLQPRTPYEVDYDEADFDPNLRTVYRKMTPEDLDHFVYRMYAPHKHSAPRRDIYDEKKELERRMNTFRDDIPVNKPPMSFRGDPYERDEDDEEMWDGKKLSVQEKEELHKRLFEASKVKQERQKLREEEYQRKLAGECQSAGKLTKKRQAELYERVSRMKGPPKPEQLQMKKLAPSALDKNYERLSKPRVHNAEAPRPSEFDKVKKVKLTREQYNKMMQHLAPEKAEDEQKRLALAAATKAKANSDKKQWQTTW